MTPHKHAEVIKAWADGAAIQLLRIDGVWLDCDQDGPSWEESITYRVKPAHTTRELAIAQAVLVACMNSRFTIPGEDGIDLAAIIATVKD